MVLLLWIFYVFVLSCVCYVFVRVCSYVLCGHLLGKGWSLGPRFWCLTVSLSLSHLYPGSGVVLDCIDFWSLHPYLLLSILSESSRNLEVELNASTTSAWLLSERDNMKSLSQQNKNKSATKGAQLVPIGIPTICPYNFEPNLINILSKR